MQISFLPLVIASVAKQSGGGATVILSEAKNLLPQQTRPPTRKLPPPPSLPTCSLARLPVRPSARMSFLTLALPDDTVPNWHQPCHSLTL